MKHLLIIPLLAIAGCAGFPVLDPQTQGERASGYTYIPVDPFSVKTVPGDSCFTEDLIQATRLGESATPFEMLNAEKRLRDEVRRLSAVNPEKDQELIFRDILHSFPDNAVRVSQEQISGSGNLTFGTSSVAAEGEDYKVTVDYTNSDTVNFEVYLAKLVVSGPGDPGEISPIFSSVPSTHYVDRYLVQRFENTEPQSRDQHAIREGYEKFNIPVYVGVGLRVIAHIRTIEGNANISGLGVIGAEANAGRLSGSLNIQTLGVNGKLISPALPIHSELNRTTAQNAIVSVASIKALLYDEETEIAPRVVGLYLPFPGDKSLVNALISELSAERLNWHRPCQANSDVQ